MTDEIFNGLLDVFNSTSTEFLTLEQITRRMMSKGYYPNSEFNRARSDVLSHLKPPIRQTLKGDKWWLPPNTKHLRNQTDRFSSLDIGEKISHEIHDESEIVNGAIRLRGNNFDKLYASMSGGQQKNRNINIIYYGTENVTCSVVEDNRDNKLLKSLSLRKWYEENGIVPGDKIWLIVERIIPLEIRIYTAWERNPDTYRKHRQSKSLPSVDLPIRDIIYDFFTQLKKIAHRSVISEDVIKKRPMISARSIDVCLGYYPDLFTPFQRGFWGLKEWDLEQVTYVRPKSGNAEKNTEVENQPISTANIDEILADINAEDLVYRILETSKDSLKALEITERVAKNLGIEKSILERTTFINVSDSRIVRLDDGSFTLRAKREKLEKIVDELGIKERELTRSLEAVKEEVFSLKNEIESISTHHNKKIEQLEEERDSALESVEGLFEQYEEITSHWEKRTQLLSKFLTEAIPHIGQNKLKEIFERLRHKPELRDSNESG